MTYENYVEAFMLALSHSMTKEAYAAFVAGMAFAGVMLYAENHTQEEEFIEPECDEAFVAMWMFGDK